MTGVGLVIVSHSATLASGVVEVAAQMAPDVTVRAAGGLPDGGIGTDFEAVLAAVTEADSGSGVVLLYDLGSAQMTAELAVESLADPGSAVVVDAPLVEGAVAAAVAAQGGGDRGAVADAARVAGGAAGSEDASADAAADDTAGGADGARAEITLTNEVGLHARPAALLTRTIADLDADVRIASGETEADGKSVFSLMSLAARKGDTIVVSATGSQADEAVQRIVELAGRDFDE